MLLLKRICLGHHQERWEVKELFKSKRNELLPLFERLQLCLEIKPSQIIMPMYASWDL